MKLKNNQNKALTAKNQTFGSSSRGGVVKVTNQGLGSKLTKDKYITHVEVEKSGNASMETSK